MKRGLLIKIFFVFLLVLFFTDSVFSLGVSPAKRDVNFRPNLETSVSYTVFGDDPNQELELFVEGDLAEYVTLNKDVLMGGGSFVATLRLPDKLERPGKHITYVGVREKVDPELLEEMIGTSITLLSVLEVSVPYPGKYLEINLESHDVNVNEPVRFLLNIKSHGTESVNVNPRIGVKSDSGEIIDTLFFRERVINSQESITLTKTLDTTGLNPGKYNASAVVDYDGEIATSWSDFRIGELIINIVNNTEEVVIDKIQPFEVSIESGWNDEIDGAYANIFIFDIVGGQRLAEFKTSSTNLIPWEKKTIVGYFDASDFSEGIYNANITLVYYGKDVGKSTSKIVEVKFIKKPSNLRLIIGVIIIIILILGFVFWRSWRSGKKRKQKK